MSQEELTLLLIFVISFLVSISLYTIWMWLDLWATKRALGHINQTHFGEYNPPIGCFGFFVWPLVAATVISFFVLVR